MSSNGLPRGRILHAPADVGGQAFGLSRAERELGLVSDVAVFAPGPLGYGYDIDLRAGIDRPVWMRLLRRARFLRRAVSEYDVFHFNFGQTLLTVRQLGFAFDEVAWLKRRGKTVLVTYQGSDIRPASVCPCGRAECLREDRYRQPAARRILASADRVFYLNPDLGQWLPGATFVPYASVDARAFDPTPPPDTDEIVVVHAPTDAAVKGTRHVIAGVEALRAAGVRVRLDLIRGTSQREVLERMRAAHVVVDQLLLGWYGAVAVEAMALARPVLAFIREDERADNPFGDDLPIVRTSVETFERDLAALVTDGRRRAELGRAGRLFAEREHDPREIARTVLDGVVPLPERAYAA